MIPRHAIQETNTRRCFDIGPNPGISTMKMAEGLAAHMARYPMNRPGAGPEVKFLSVHMELEAFEGTSHAGHYLSSLLPPVSCREEMALATTRGIVVTLLAPIPGIVTHDEMPAEKTMELVAAAKRRLIELLVVTHHHEVVLFEGHNLVQYMPNAITTAEFLAAHYMLHAPPYNERPWFKTELPSGLNFITTTSLPTYVLLPRGRAQVFTSLGVIMPRPRHYTPSLYRRLAGLEEIRPGNGSVAHMKPSTLWSMGCAQLHGLVHDILERTLYAPLFTSSGQVLVSMTGGGFSISLAMEKNSNRLRIGMEDVDVTRIYRVRSLDNRETYVYDPVVVFHMCQLFYLTWTTLVHQLIMGGGCGGEFAQIQTIDVHTTPGLRARGPGKEGVVYRDIELLPRTMGETNEAIFEQLRDSPYYEPLRDTNARTGTGDMEHVISIGVGPSL